MTYYRSIEEIENPQTPHDIDDGRTEVGRRDFLKLAGFSLAAVAVTGCQRPLVERAVPYLTAPEEIVPGRGYWMASTCHGCPARCGVLVKCRDGRPIKIEGNPDHPVSRGGVCAVGQAMLLGLYDSQRLAGPRLHAEASNWPAVDRFVADKLSGARSVRVVSSTIPSPTTSRIIREFLARFEDGRHVVYDVPSCSTIAEAHERTHALRAVPRYRFDEADVVVSFDADFLGTWISPVEFTKQWSTRRSSTTPQRPWHTQLESRMSLTGGKADQRLRLHPNETTAVLAYLAATLGRNHTAQAQLPFKAVVVERIADRLRNTSGRSLVISGSSRLDDQLLVNQINESLGNYGSTIDLAAPSNQRQGNDGDLAQLIADVATGKVDALFALECNPVYDLPQGDELVPLLRRMPLVVSFASHLDETTKHAHVVAPDHHPLESWHDNEPVTGIYAVTQPTVAPLRNTRAAIESFAAWSGKPARAYDLIRANAPVADWDKTLNDGFASTSSGLRPVGEGGPERSEGPDEGHAAGTILPSTTPLTRRFAPPSPGGLGCEGSGSATGLLPAGEGGPERSEGPDEGRAAATIVSSTTPLTRRSAPPSPGGRGSEGSRSSSGLLPAGEGGPERSEGPDEGRAAATIVSSTTPLTRRSAATIVPSTTPPSPGGRGSEGFAVVLYPTIVQLDGRHAHNAWLHELPDPITKVTWDNYACISPETAKRLGIKDGDVVRLTDNRQPAANILELPAFIQPGQHDRVVAIALGYGRSGTDRFAKIGPHWLLQRTWLTPGATVGKRAVQLSGAEVSIEKTGRTYDLAMTQLHGTMDGRQPVEEQAAGAVAEPPTRTDETDNLWPAKAKGPHQWAMAIDLARCTGCSACVIACQAENNVPVVGKDEVLREREMHWVRIDRYYAGEGDETRVLHQPVMCQHCGNAPCETVCPVLATVHSSDGLNQQVYNRCVGTRYCANNCPYKTRRFNWFDYPHEDRLANLALNPDVTVRTRGVMEKCSMCVQRIEEVRIVAKQRGIPIADGAIRTACEQSCPADAIVFGDLQNPKSRIAAARRDPRHYLLLEELNVRPAVGYLKAVSSVHPDATI